MAENFTVGIYKYTTIPNSFTAKIGNAINQYTENSGIIDVNYAYPVIIPSYVYYKNNKFEIVEIGLAAFRNCRKISKVIIPQTIVTINTWAFDWLVSCTEFVFLPGSRLTTINDKAFGRCYSLTTLVLPSSVRRIGFGGLACMKIMKFLYICGNPSIDADILYDVVRKNDVAAPDDLQIFVPLDFNGTSQTRTFTKSYFPKICDFSIICHSCFDCTFYLRTLSIFTSIFISV